MPPRVAVILLNLNQEQHTLECIESLLRISYPDIDIILIDNGSKDGSGVRLHERFPGITFVHLEKNLGFSGGNNVGIRLALERRADYIMLLNNDTLVDRDFVGPLVERAESDLTIGMQSCKIYFHNMPRILWYAGAEVDADRALVVHRGLLQPDTGQFDNEEETDLATGCMLFTSRRVVEAVGMLDEDLFAYFEDLEWSMRTLSAGYRILYNPRSLIWHKVSATSTIDSPLYLYFTIRNKIIMLRRHSTWTARLKNAPYFVYFFGRHLVRMSLKWRDIPGTKAVLSGMIDGFRDYTGEGGKGSFARYL